MRILWVVNFPLPMMRGSENTLKESGGWMEALLRGLAKDGEFELHVAAPEKNTAIDAAVVDGVHFHTVKAGYVTRVLKTSGALRRDFSRLISSVKPDLVHIHGTEFPFMEDALDAAKEAGVFAVTSIQGLISEICKKENHYAGICEGSFLGAVFKYGARAMLPIAANRVISKIRAKSELRQIQKNENLVGRTDWDRAHCAAVNPGAKYYCVQEMLRGDFFDQSWSFEESERGRIFCAGGCRSPIKGFHHILRAVAILKSRGTKITVTTVGGSPLKGRASGYRLYLRRLIKRLALEDDVLFLGALSAKEMAAEFKKADMYVMGSSVENSSNTLGEALTVGVPSIAPYVGGIPSIAAADREVLSYQFGDDDMLAVRIEKLLSDKELKVALSEGAHRLKSTQYDKDAILEAYINLYKTIVGA